MTTAFVAGSTGYTGRALVQALRRQDIATVAHVRPGSRALEEVATPGSSGLSYDAATDTYSYVWKTNKSWAGTCRMLTVKLADGSIHVAYFKLK